MWYNPLVTWLLLPSHLPDPGYLGLVNVRITVARLCLCLVVAVEALRFAQNVALWVLVYRMRDPLYRECAHALVDTTAQDVARATADVLTVLLARIDAPD